MHLKFLFFLSKRNLSLLIKIHVVNEWYVYLYNLWKYKTEKYVHVILITALYFILKYFLSKYD